MDKDFNIDKILTSLDRYKAPLILGLLGILFIGLGFLLPKLHLEPKEVKIEDTKEIEEQALIKVDVAGAVKAPGVYEVEQGGRVLDAIYKAGGFSNDVDSNSVASELNLAAKLADGQKIYVKRIGDTQSVIGATTEVKGGLVNVNNASAKELDKLPGVGEVTANKIISGRPYQNKEDLLTKKVVGKATFEKIKDLISVY